MKGWLLMGWMALAQEGSVDTGLDGVNRARLNRAGHLLAAGGHEEARGEFQRVLEVRNDSPRALLGLALALEGLGRLDLAEQTWRRLPTHPDAVEGLARLLLVGRPQESLVLARRLQTLRLGEAPPHLLESRAALAGQDLRMASPRMGVLVRRWQQRSAILPGLIGKSFPKKAPGICSG